MRMIEKIITSKTRVKLLNLFLAHIDDRYYLRELERKLDESLSPLRRQLIKLEKMGILIAEEEANLKYYRLNKSFAGIEELRRLVLGKENVAAELALPKVQEDKASFTATPAVAAQGAAATPAQKRVRYDIAVLTVVSFFVLLTAAFIVYSSARNMDRVTGLVSEKKDKIIFADDVGRTSSAATRSDEMISRRWKMRAGSFPVFSSGETGEAKSQEL